MIFSLPIRMQVAEDLYDSVLENIYISYPEFKNYIVSETCISNISPLTSVYEFNVNNSRKYICAQNPWRTNGLWMNVIYSVEKPILEQFPVK